MNRRSFLRRLAASVIALTLARHLPGIAPEPVGLPVPAIEDKETGISMRLIKEFDVEHVRFDVIYGWSDLSHFAVRVQA